ncbi:MAG TPA: MFS transporter [Candidatus Limnocylindrales bacterium]|nr:MFS transporter [Candidatus Limnocylindrales bacterium]
MLARSLVTANSEVGARARRKIAWRLLPFVFLLYLVAYLDRANVSFAALKMNLDLGFSDRVYGLGVAMFFVGYVLLEVPGAIIVERWSARKWTARIMVSWGLVTIFSGLVHSPGQFYAARFFLGAAEASFFPGMIVYLTHWIRLSERGRAVAVLYAAIPSSAVIGAPLAGWLLGIGWRGMAGWRWLFILEGVPAIIMGVVTFFYLTDWPKQAKWLSTDERDWITSELELEKEAKKETAHYTVWRAFRDPRVLLLLLPYLLANTSNASVVFWLPTFIKRLSGLSSSKVAFLVLLPAIAGLFGLLINGWHSDKTGERRWHTAIPLASVGVTYLLLIPASAHFPLAMILFAIGGGFVFAYYPAFWSMPTMILSESAAAATFGLINSVGHAGGFFGPYIIGDLSTRTGSFLPGFAFIAVCYLLAAFFVTRLKIQDSARGAAGSLPQLHSSVGS